MDDILNRIAELEALIAALPVGSITKKTVRGKVYYYHRWTEDKKRREKYIPEEEVPALRAQIEERKALEAELKVLKKQPPKKPAPKKKVNPVKERKRLAKLEGKKKKSPFEDKKGRDKRLPAKKVK